MNLFVNYYIDPNEERQKEIDLCLKINLDNDIIKRIYVFLDNGTGFGSRFQHEKIYIIPFVGRPAFKYFFKAINLYLELDGMSDISVVANSDIYLPSEPWPILPKHNECFALTRWDILPDGSEKFYNNSGSQDTWVFRGPIKQVKGADYTQGVAGCDNKIAWDLERAGYRVSNPSLTIKTYHLHNSGVRHYDKKEPGKKDIYRLPPPRKNVSITKL